MGAPVGMAAAKDAFRGTAGRATPVTGREVGATERRLEEAMEALADTVQSVDHLAARVSERLLGHGLPARGESAEKVPDPSGILPVTTQRVRRLTERLQDARDVLANLATELGAEATL